MDVAVRGRSAAPISTRILRSKQAREAAALERPRPAGRNPVFDGDRFSADYFETDFASFLAWRDWGFPDKNVFNGFGHGRAALQ